MKKYLALILALVMALSLAACGGSSGSSAKTDSKSDSAELPTLRVAAMPFITSLPTYYIQQNNLGEKYGFKMDVTMFATGAPMNEALAADLWDVGAMGAAAVTGVANYDEMIIGEVLESVDGQSLLPPREVQPRDREGHHHSDPRGHRTAYDRSEMAGEAGHGVHRCEHREHGQRAGLSGSAGRPV